MGQTPKRDPASSRIDFHGIDLVHPVDLMPPGKFPFAQNVRRYIKGGTKSRNLLTVASETLAAAVHSLCRLNDRINTPTLVSGVADKIYVASGQVASGLSGSRVSMIPFRPDASPQVWMYIGDSSQAVTLTASGFQCTGMIKVRSDGLAAKTGVKEPQSAPIIGTQGSNTSGNFTLNVNAAPWNNIGGVNSNANYGETSTTDGGPGIIGGLTQGATLTITATGSATVNGTTHAPGDSGSTAASFPGHFAIGGSSNILLGAFTDSSGNVTLNASNVPYVYTVGASATLTVPPGAVQFQLGVDSSANTFSSNIGNFAIAWNLVTSAVATVVSTAGPVTAYYWGDSPHSGPVAEYIWKNAGDSGSGIVRSVSTAKGSASGSSLIFDSTPEDGTVPVQWSTLDSTGTVTGSFALFSPALESEGFQDFNVAVTGNLFIPTAGTYTFTIQNKDQVMFGIGGSASFPAGPAFGSFGQTESVVSALPLAYVSVPSGGGGAVTATVQVTFASSGIVPFELDWDYWFHTGRKLIMQCSPVGGGAAATIPPLSTGQYHINAQYIYRYRSSITGAKSNGSPPSSPVVIPLQANSVTSAWSNDPQIDLVDYFRKDNGLSSYTLVAVGPNDNSGSGTNTAITDNLTDAAAAGNPILETDNFEPFPGIDRPKNGVVNVGNGGVITWVSGDQFNVRWLPNTIIEIGSPTSIAYDFVTRPISTTKMIIPGVTAGNNLVYHISEPLLAQVALPYLFGPTDNINFVFGVGDKDRGGTMYWCNGSNLDSASDTNQMDVTDPGETLINGAMSNGRGVVFSDKRAWMILPNFFNALATANGTIGSTWTLQDSGITRGLFIARCIAMEGGGKIFFRVVDGIHVSLRGGPSVSITDDDLYPLFPHEAEKSTPTAVTRAGNTIYPPDDTKPDAQAFSVIEGYLYYDYQDSTSTPRTLVFDMQAMGWVWDVYQWPVTVRASNIGTQSSGPTSGTFVGCNDGTVREFSPSGTETATSIVMLPSYDAGDTRAQKNWKDLYIEAE